MAPSKVWLVASPRGQVVRAERDRAARVAMQRTDALRAARREIESRVRPHVHRPRLRQAAARAHDERAGVDIGVAGVGVRARERRRARAFLHHAPGPADHAREGGVGAVAEGQRIAAERHRASADTRQRPDGLIAGRGQIQRRADAGDIDGARRCQATARAYRKRSGVDGRAARVGVRAGQRFSARSLLDDATRPANRAGESLAGSVA